MTHQIIEDIALLAREFPQVPTGKLAVGLQALSSVTASLNKLNQFNCERGLTDAELNRRFKLRTKARNIVHELFGITEVLYNTDPRSIAVRFPLPSGTSNLWDKENFGVRF